MCLHVYACMCTCVCTCGDIRWISNVFLNHSSPYFLIQGLSLSLGFTSSTRLVVTWASGSTCLGLPNTQFWDYRCAPPQPSFTWWKGFTHLTASWAHPGVLNARNTSSRNTMGKRSEKTKRYLKPFRAVGIWPGFWEGSRCKQTRMRSPFRKHGETE